MQIDTLSPAGKFYSLLHELGASLGAPLRDQLEHFNEAASENIVGTIEFGNPDGIEARLRLEIEKMATDAAVRATLFFGLNAQEKEWSNEPGFLKTLLQCRVVGERCLPMAPALFPEGEMLWQMVLPLDELARNSLEAFIAAGSNFYQTAVHGIREFGFSEQLFAVLKKADRTSDALWTMRKWSELKNSHADAMENFSETGHCYRIVPASEEQFGVVAINLGNVSDFIGLDRILAMLLKINATTFLSENYYVGFDDRGGLVLLALLPPQNEEEKKRRLASLLKRAEEVRAFILQMTSELEAAAMQDDFKNLNGVTELILT